MIPYMHTELIKHPSQRHLPCTEAERTALKIKHEKMRAKQPKMNHVFRLHISKAWQNFALRGMLAKAR